MINPVDTMVDVTGWVASGGAQVHGVNAHPDMCADWLDSSAVFRFNGGAVEKTFNVDVSESTELSLSVWSRSKGHSHFQRPEDFMYKIVVNGTQEWFLPVYRTFTSVTIPLEGIDTITSLRFEAMSNADDFLVVSAVYALRDEYPLDVMQGVVRALEVARDELSPSGVFCGKVSGSAGDREVEVDWSLDYAERYSVILITDGMNTERHQIELRDGEGMRFTELYDGQALLNTYVDADVFIWFPVEFGRYEEEAVVPGIVVYALAPEPDLTSSELATRVDALSGDGSWRERKEQMGLVYQVLVTCETRSGFLGAVQNRIVRWWLGKRKVWINGRVHDIEFDQAPVASGPQGDDLLTQVQYTVRVEVREERAFRVVRGNAGAASLDVEVRRV